MQTFLVAFALIAFAPMASFSAAPSRDQSRSDVFRNISNCTISIESIGGEQNIPNSTVQKGSGFVFDAPSAKIDRFFAITAYHVVENSSLINIKFKQFPLNLSDQRDYKVQIHSAKIEYANPINDTAIISFELDNDIPCINDITFDSPDKISQADLVFILGDRFGFEKSLAGGMISGIRKIPNSTFFNPAIPYIEIDSSLNVGSSGSVVFNSNGDYIGMITTVAEFDGNFSGIAFALPFTAIKNDIESFKEVYDIEKAMLGVTLSQNSVLTKDDKLHSKFSNLQLKSGDSILEINEIQIQNIWQARAELLKMSKELSFRLKIKRNDAKIVLVMQRNK